MEPATLRVDRCGAVRRASTTAARRLRKMASAESTSVQSTTASETPTADMADVETEEPTAANEREIGKEREGPGAQSLSRDIRRTRYCRDLTNEQQDTVSSLLSLWLAREGLHYVQGMVDLFAPFAFLHFERGESARECLLRFNAFMNTCATPILGLAHPRGPRHDEAVAAAGAVAVVARTLQLVDQFELALVETRSISPVLTCLTQCVQVDSMGELLDFMEHLQVSPAGTVQLCVAAYWAIVNDECGSIEAYRPDHWCPSLSHVRSVN